MRVTPLLLLLLLVSERHTGGVGVGERWKAVRAHARRKAEFLLELR
jgi:hypothetical protein